MNASPLSPGIILRSTTVTPKPPLLTPHSEEQSFLCTFCWLVHPKLNANPDFSSRDHFHIPTQPKSLGRSSRLACYSCWSRILDLSICWVCGEIVVRDEDVVSLGWCFWHRACLGCLICGMKISIDNVALLVEKDELESDDRQVKSKDIGRSGGKTATGRLQSELSIIEEVRRQSEKRHPKTLELQSIPLCAEHMAETETETRNQQPIPGSPKMTHNSAMQLLEGKKNIKFSDGGLSEARWNMMVERGIGDEKGLIDISAVPSPAPPPTPPIYVSIFDPLKEPAFRSSRTKPVPQWMAFPEYEHSQQQALQESERVYEKKRMIGDLTEAEAGLKESVAKDIRMASTKPPGSIIDAEQLSILPSPPPEVTEIRKKNKEKYHNEPPLPNLRFGRSRTTVIQPSPSSGSSVSRYRALYEERSGSMRNASQNNDSLMVPINRPLVRTSRSFTASASSSEDNPTIWYEAREHPTPPPHSHPMSVGMAMKNTASPLHCSSGPQNSQSRYGSRDTEQDANSLKDNHRDGRSVIEQFKRQEKRRQQMQMSMDMLREQRQTEMEKTNDIDGKSNLRLELKRLFNER